MRRHARTPMLYPELFKAFEARALDLDAGRSVERAFDADAAVRRAGAHDQDERDHRMGRAAGDGNVPARQPRTTAISRAFMSIWFYEEQKHALVLMEYLRRFRPDLVPTEAELHAVRFEFDPAPPLETLMLHFCGEIRLEPLVSPRRGVAHRARDQADLRAHLARRGAARRCVSPLHETRARARRRGSASARSRRSAC